MTSSKCTDEYLKNHYPPAGGDGKGDNPCDDWPQVNPAHVKKEGTCECPPDKGKYEATKAAAWLNIIPMIGSVISGAIGVPGNCLVSFNNSVNKYQDAQKEFVAMIQAMENRFESVVQVMGQIYTGETSGDPKGILPDAVRAAIAPVMHVTVYMTIIAVAVFLVLVGVVFTM